MYRKNLLTIVNDKEKSESTNMVTFSNSSKIIVKRSVGRSFFSSNLNSFYIR